MRRNCRKRNFVCLATTTAIALPPECSSYVTNTDATRRSTYSESIGRCDHPTPFGSPIAWVRFSGAAGTMMASSVVTSNRCGTSATGWYNGSYPDVGSTTNGTVCYNFIDNSCWKSNRVSVTNCNTFYVYQLPPTSQCYMRYCTT